MDRRSKIILGIFIMVMVAIIITEIVRPKPLNWSPSYTSNDKIPFGCYILNNELENLFPNQEIKNIDKSPYQFLSETDVDFNSNLLFVNNYLNFDEEELDEILNYVDKGNNVFLSASDFSQAFKDTLKIDIYTQRNFSEDSVIAQMTNPNFKKQEFVYTRGVFKSYFSSIDTIKTTVLGYFKKEIDEPQRINFIKVNIGNGTLFLHTLPQAFTNYYLLKDNKQYAANCLSYLDKGTIYWDDYYKIGRVIIDSPMRFVLNQESLKWAYYLLVALLILFVIFKAKREQRIIPVIKPLENSSVEFTRTIGDLYFQHKNYTNIILKKVTFFMDYIRSHFYLETEDLNDNFIKKLAVKASKSVEETTTVINFIKMLKNKPLHTEQELIELNKLIEDFKKN